MPNLADLVLWGIPLVGLVSALVSLIKWIWEGYNEKVVTLIGAVLTGLGAIFIFSLADLLVMFPGLEVWGPRILWALTLMLIYTGHYPLVGRLRFKLQTLCPTFIEMQTEWGLDCCDCDPDTTDYAVEAEYFGG